MTIKYAVKGEDGIYGAWSETAPSITDAGVLTYKVQASNPNYNTVVSDEYTLKVNQKAIVVNATVNRAYNGLDQVLTLTAADATSKPVDGETLTLTDATITGKNASTTAYTTVSEYSWSVKKGEGDEAVDTTKNYTINVTGALTITPKPVEITVTKASKTYGEPDPKFEGKVDGLLKEGDLGTITYSRIPATQTRAKAVTLEENVGTYKEVLTADFTKNSNYAPVIKQADFDITKATLTVKVADTTKVYGDNEPKYELTIVSGLKVGDDGEAILKSLKAKFVRLNKDGKVPVEGDPIADFENVGTYSVTAEEGLTETENYKVVYQPGTLTIAPKEIVVMAPTVTLNYASNADDPALKPTLNEGPYEEGKELKPITALPFGENPEEKITYTLTIDRQKSDLYVAGKYTLKVTGEEKQGNYHVTFKEGTLTTENAPLFNQVNVVDSMGVKGTGYYRITKTDSGILTEKSLEEYLSNVTDKETLRGTVKYNSKLVEEYDFSGLTIIINGFSYAYSDGTDVAEREGKEDFYTVNTGWYVNAMKDITCTNGWLVGEPEVTKDAELTGTGFVRKYTITLHHNLKVKQAMNNYISVNEDPAHSGVDYYRLNVDTIYGPDPHKFLEGNSFNNNPNRTKYWTDTENSTYNNKNNFKDVVLTYNTKTYEFSAEEKEEGSIYHRYYTVKDDSSAGKKDYDFKRYIHGGKAQSDWFGKELGWKDNSQKDYATWEITTNEFISWHRNFRAYLHNENAFTGTLTLTAVSASKPYDGTELTKGGENKTYIPGSEDNVFTVEGLPEKGTYTVTATVEGSATYVGDEGKNVIKRESIKITNQYGEDVTDLFPANRIVLVDGKLTINQAPLTITAKAQTEFVYDGTAQGENNATYTNEEVLSKVALGTVNSEGKLIETLPADHQLSSISLNGTETYVRYKEEGGAKSVTVSDTKIVPSTAVIYDKDGKKVTDQFAINYVDGDLQINPKTVTIAVNAQEYQYNAQDQGETGEDGKTYTANLNTKVTINPKNKPITEDGLATGDSLSSITLKGAEKNVKRDSNGKVSAYEKKIDLTNAKITAEVNGEEKDVTGCYTIVPESGNLTITAKPLTLTSGSLTREYNGKALTNAEVENTNENGLTVENGWIPGEGATYTLDATVTDAGKQVTNAFTITTKAGTDLNNYDLTKTEGTLKVVNNMKAIVIASEDRSFVYNGDTHKHEVYTVTYDGTAVSAVADKDGKEFKLSTGDTVKITPTADGVKYYDANYKENNTFTYTLENSNFYGNVTYNYGTLTIIPKTVTIAVEPQTYEYNGLDQGETGDEGQTYTANLDKKVTVNPDNKPVDEDGLVAGDSLSSITLKGTARNVNRNVNDEVTAHTEVIDLIGEQITTLVGDEVTDITSSYKIVPVKGNVTITAKDLTLTSGSRTREYNGTALTNAEVENTNDNGLIVEDGWIPGEGATYAFTESALKAGDEANNEFTATAKAGTLLTNYNVIPSTGKLTVTANTTPIVIRSSTRAWTYDGDPHKDDVYTVTYGGQAVTADATGKIFTLPTNDKVAITSTVVEGVTNFNAEYKENNTFTYVIENADNYTTVSYNFGTLSIDKKLLTLTSGSRTREYNGDTLTNDDVENKLPSGLTVESGWVKEEGATYEFTGSALLAGDNNANAFTIAPKTGTLMDNYQLNKTEGRLNVTDRTNKYVINVTAKSSLINTYDGARKSVSGFEGESTTFTIDGHTYTLSGLDTSDPERIDATDANGIPNAIIGTEKVTDALGNDVTGQFTVGKTDGKLVIDRRLITITVMAESKFQGENDPTFRNAVLSERFTELDNIDLKVKRTNTAEDVNTYPNVLTITPTKAELERDYPNFEFTINNGTFTIKPTETYGLKVTYKYSNGDVADTFSKTDYSAGDKATAQRKIPDGYTAEINLISTTDLTNPVNTVDKDKKLTTISGNVGTTGVEYEVIYTPAQYTLTIDFQVYGDEDIVATITRKYYGGADYSVLNSDGDIPWDQLPKGYRIVEVTKKVMPNGDYEIVVYVVAEGDDTVTFLDDPTPLGINNATLGAGEIIE